MKRFPTLLCCLVLTTTIAGAQTWEPAARIWDVETLPLIVQVPGGPPLVQLRSLLGSPKPTVFTLFDLTTLSPSSQPYENPLELGYVIGAGDFNGNGILDYMGGLPPAPFTHALVFDAYTPLEKLVIPTVEYPVGGGFDRQLSYEGDLDGDGFNDSFYGRTPPPTASISYGDSVNPLTQFSRVVVELRNIQKDDRLIALGELSGRFFILRMIWEQINDGKPEYARYQLIELDSADLRARKDTIGTHIIHNFRPERGYVYASPVIRADTVWWVGTGSWTDRRFLKITTTKIEEVAPAIEWLSSRFNANLEETWIYGQKRIGNDRPVVIDASRPMLYFTYYSENGITSPYFEYSRIINTDNLTREILGRARGQQFSPNDGGFLRATLTPDIDGDRLEDFVVLYVAQPESGGKDKNASDLYLTTGRVMTSVMKDLLSDPQSTSSLTAVRFDGYWEVVGPVPCLGSNTAPIYDVKGSLVGWARLERAQTLRIIDPGNLRGGPHWVVVGDCAIKVL